MTSTEHTAFNAGIAAVRHAALAAAATIEARSDAGDVRQQATIAALQGLADGSRALLADSRASPAFDGPSAALLDDPEPPDAVAVLRVALGQVAGLAPLQAREDAPETVRQTVALVADEPGESGTVACPGSGKALEWMRAVGTSAWCETEGCVAWLS